MRASYRFTVHGRVQGVYFRQSTCEQARRLQLDGWVMNRADGAVEGLACGSPEALAQLHQWLQRGPELARVDAVEWGADAQSPEPGFSVRRS